MPWRRTRCTRHEADLEREEAEARQPPRFWGVFSEEPGASGVYTVEAQALRLVEPDAAAKYGSLMAAFGTRQAAAEYVARMTRTRAPTRAQRSVTPGAAVTASDRAVVAKEAVPGYGQRGSSTKITHLDEKLAPRRMASIQACIDGQCGLLRDGSETKCRGGCGRSLHLVSCAQVGKGFAALGNFSHVSSAV